MKEEPKMNAYIICQRKVQPSENWVRCHLWGGFAVFTGSASENTSTPTAKSGSKTSSGKRLATRGVNNPGFEI
jgi:hypothetical protein